MSRRRVSRPPRESAGCTDHGRLDFGPHRVGDDRIGVTDVACDLGVLRENPGLVGPRDEPRHRRLAFGRVVFPPDVVHRHHEHGPRQARCGGGPSVSAPRAPSRRARRRACCAPLIRSPAEACQSVDVRRRSPRSSRMPQLPEPAPNQAPPDGARRAVANAALKTLRASAVLASLTASPPPSRSLRPNRFLPRAPR